MPTTANQSILVIKRSVFRTFPQYAVTMFETLEIVVSRNADWRAVIHKHVLFDTDQPAVNIDFRLRRLYRHPMLPTIHRVIASSSNSDRLRARSPAVRQNHRRLQASRYRSLLLTGTLAICGPALAMAQSTQTITTKQHMFFEYAFRTIANLDYAATYKTHFEDTFKAKVGLSEQEAAALHSIAISFQSVLVSTRQSAASIVKNKPVLLDSDAAALRALSAEQATAIDTMASQFLASVSSATAARLRQAAEVVPVNLASTGGQQ